MRANKSQFNSINLTMVVEMTVRLRSDCYQVVDKKGLSKCTTLELLLLLYCQLKIQIKAG